MCRDVSMHSTHPHPLVTIVHTFWFESVIWIKQALEASHRQTGSHCTNSKTLLRQEHLWLNEASETERICLTWRRGCGSLQTILHPRNPSDLLPFTTRLLLHAGPQQSDLPKTKMNEDNRPVYIQLHPQSCCSNQFVKNGLLAYNTDPSLWYGSRSSTQEVPICIPDRLKSRKTDLMQKPKYSGYCGSYIFIL